MMWQPPHLDSVPKTFYTYAYIVCQTLSQAQGTYMQTQIGSTQARSLIDVLPSTTHVYTKLGSTQAGSLIDVLSSTCTSNCVFHCTTI